MSFILNNEIQFSDSPNLDGFGRLRVSNPFSLSDYRFPYDKESLKWDEKLVSGATSTWTSASTIDLQVSAVTNSRVVRQTKTYEVYQPGKSLFILATGVLNTNGGESGLVSKIGYFDDKDDKVSGPLNGNGVYFQLSGTQLSVVLRNTIASSSTQSDTIVPQSQWNVDNFLGTGGTGNPSRLGFDVSKAQLFWFTIEWLGVGRMQAGFVMNGTFYPCHSFNSANTLTTTYMNTASLPVRYEFHNVGGASTTSKMVQICSTVISEGGYEVTGKYFSVDRGSNSKTISANAVDQALISIRLHSNGIRNIVKPIGLDVLCTTSAPSRWALILNASINGATWSGTSANTSHVEVDINGTTATGGTILDSGYFSTQINLVDRFVNSTLNLVSNISGGSDTISLVVSNLNNQAETYYGGIRYLELD